MKSRLDPLVSFLLLTFAISWTIWGLSPLASAGNTGIQRMLDSMGAGGPAFAALIICYLSSSERRSPFSPTAFFISFAVAFAVGLGAMPLLFMTEFTLGSLAALTLLAASSAVIIAAAFSTNKGVLSIMSSLRAWRVAGRWYVYALLLYPAFSLGGLLITRLMGEEVALLRLQETLPQTIYYTVVMLAAILLFGGPLGEEPGWRGFAMHRLMGRYSAFKATLILGLVWTTWHAPLHFNGFYGSGWPGFISRFLWNIPLTFLFTWLFLHTKGNVFMAVLLHTATNGAGVILPFSERAGIISFLIMILFLVASTFIDPAWKLKEPLGSKPTTLQT